MRRNINNKQYRFSKTLINEFKNGSVNSKRIFESEEKKEVKLSNEKAKEMLNDGSAYIDFNEIPEKDRKNVVAEFKKNGLTLQNTTAKLVAKMFPTAATLGKHFEKNKEKVNILIGLGMAAGILSQFGISIDTCCASAALAMTPKMIEILCKLGKDFNINDEE